MGGGGEWRKYLVRLVSRQRKLQVQSETVSFSGWNYDEQRGEVFQALFHPPQRKRENMEIYSLHRLLEEEGFGTF